MSAADPAGHLSPEAAATADSRSLQAAAAAEPCRHFQQHDAALSVADMFCPDSEYLEKKRGELARERQADRERLARERKREMETFTNSLKNMLNPMS